MDFGFGECSTVFLDREIVQVKGDKKDIKQTKQL